MLRAGSFLPCSSQPPPPPPPPLPPQGGFLQVKQLLRLLSQPGNPCLKRVRCLQQVESMQACGSCSSAHTQCLKHGLSPSDTYTLCSYSSPDCLKEEKNHKHCTDRKPGKYPLGMRDGQLTTTSTFCPVRNNNSGQKTDTKNFSTSVTHCTFPPSMWLLFT